MEEINPLVEVRFQHIYSNEDNVLLDRVGTVVEWKLRICRYLKKSEDGMVVFSRMSENCGKLEVVEMSFK